MNKGEIILYQPQGENVEIDVLVEDETVWLTQAQMAELFETSKQNVGQHIRNAFNDGEIVREVVVKKIFITTHHGAMPRKTQSRMVEHYNLDVIISVGYRVKSQRGVQFRRWATQVLKDYILRGYAIDKRIDRLESQMTETMSRVAETEKKIGFFVRTALPPVEGVFYQGEIFDAHVFTSDLIKTAKRRIVLFDNYADESTLLLLSKRKPKVTAEIYTRQISKQLQLDLTKHNAQYDPITINTTANFHDRFLILDDAVYHIGASLKDLGRKLFAFSKIDIRPKELFKGI
jgi:hypothetical protein